MEIGTIIAVLSFALAVLGSIFKTWIIDPLSSAIRALSENVKEMKVLVNTMKETQEEVRRKMAVLENDVDNINKRVDKLEEQIGHMLMDGDHK